MTRRASGIRLLVVLCFAALASATSAAISAAPARADRVPPAPPSRAVPEPREQPTGPEAPSEAPAEQPPPADGGAPPAAPGPSEAPAPETPGAPATPPALARPALRPSPGPLDPTPGDYPPLGSTGERSHDPGFFLRLLLGPATLTAQTGSRSLSGGGMDFGVAVGAAIRRDLILHLGLLAGFLGSATYKVDGETMDRDFTATATAYGPGVTYYFSHNLYATGAVYASWLRRTGTREGPPDFFGNPVVEKFEERSDVGIGASAAVGKEWWLTDSWGLGIAARAFLASVPDATSAGTTWGVHSFSLLLSVTMN